jgi:hypothetical protein
MGSGGIAPSFLTSALDGGELSVSRRPLYPREKSPRFALDMRLGGPRAGLEAVEKRKLSLAGNRTPVVQPIARRYTD